MPSPICLLPVSSSPPDGEAHETGALHYSVSNNNRWSRAVLTFEGLEPDAWCEFTFQLEWHPLEENRGAHDFAVAGFDFQTEDGSSIEFAHVPGLTRTQIDPHSWSFGCPDDPARGGTSWRMRLGFLAPAPARKLAVSIRSWRNSHPFTIRDPKLFQEPSRRGADDARALPPVSPRDAWRVLGTEPSWFRFAVLAGRRLLVRGQIINESLAAGGALARIVYRDAQGEELPPPYPDLPVAPGTGAFIDIPVHRQARRFTLDLVPPAEAAGVEIGFQTWHADARVELVTPLEVSLEDDLSLEANAGDDQTDAPTFLGRLLDKLGDADRPDGQIADLEPSAAGLTFQDKLAAVQRGKTTTVTDGGLALGAFPAWPLPDAPEWTEDPFRSPAWRLEFQSLTWLRALAEKGGRAGLARAMALAASWSQANPWGHPADPISTHPLALSGRAETLLFLASRAEEAQPASDGDAAVIRAETVRHAVALAEILGQNVCPQSGAHLHVACALWAVARALPRLPLAPFWTSLALTHLRGGFERLVGQDGALTQSPHERLELLSLGLILMRHLENTPGTRDVRDDLMARLRNGLRVLVAVTTPSGSLPPFGDAPHGFHHASWLRRLLSAYGTGLLSDPELASELSYPTGTKIFASAQAGLIAVRHYERHARWSYLGASLTGRCHDVGHHDCTSFVYATGGAPWIVDARGSGLHDTEAASEYLTGSRAHNVALPDGREQIAGLGWIEAHEERDGAAVVCLGSNVHGPAYEHRRIFILLDRLDAVAVIDRFASRPQPISFNGMLHFDPAIVAAIANTSLGAAYRKNEKLRIIPYAVEGRFGGMGVENGCSDTPATMQGFVARPTGGLQPANVLRYRFSGQGTVCGGVLLASSDQAARHLSRLMETDWIRAVLAGRAEARA